MTIRGTSNGASVDDIFTVTVSPVITLPESTRLQDIDIQFSEADVTEMCISNIGWENCHWESYAEQIHWTLTEGAGRKTIYFSFKNHADTLISQSQSIIYTPNHPPTADDYTIVKHTSDSFSLQLKARDEDQDILYFSNLEPCTLGDFHLNSETGIVHYTPVENGEDQCTFVANDGFTNSAPAIIRIKLYFDNDPPVIQGLYDDTVPKQQKNLSWSGTDQSLPVVFRYVIDQEASHDDLSGDFSEHHTAHYNDFTGKIYLHVQAKDHKGNISEVQSVSAILDNTPPQKPRLNDADNVSGDIYTFLTNNDSFVLNGSKENHSDIMINKLLVDKTSVDLTTWQYAPDLVEGTQTYIIYAQDMAKNESQPITAHVTLDTIPPQHGTYSRTPSGPNVYTTNVKIQVSGDDVTHYRFQLDGQPESQEYPVDQLLRLTDLTASKLPGIQHDLKLSVRDAAGNWKTLISDSWKNRISNLRILSVDFPDKFVQDDNSIRMMKNEFFTASVKIFGGQKPYTYSLSDEENLSLSPSSMPTSAPVIIQGAFPVSGSKSFAINVTDANQTSTSRTIEIEVLDNLSIKPSVISKGTVGIDFSDVTFGVNGGCGNYDVQAEVDTNQIFCHDNVLSVNTSRPLQSSLWIHAVDDCGYTVSQQYSVIIRDPLTIETDRLYDGIVHRDYNTQLIVKGGSGHYEWDIYDGTLPAGVTLDADSGSVSGTPTQLFKNP